MPAGAPFGEIKNGQYVVAPGDTVAIVSERTNTPIRTLIDLNGLTPPYALKAGQMLNLQPRNNYVVQKGDTRLRHLRAPGRLDQLSKEIGQAKAKGEDAAA